MSACGAVAGIVMIASYRESLIPDALIALEVIEAAAMIGVALAAGELAFVYEGVERLVLDSLLIVVGGVIVVLLKQAFFHRRAPRV